MAGAGNGGESRGSMRAEIAAETVLVVAEMAAAVAVVAAMATVAMAATTRQPWQWRRCSFCAGGMPDPDLVLPTDDGAAAWRRPMHRRWR